MFCSRCGTSLADGSQFCVDCGHTVEGSFPAAPAPSSEVVCGKCGKPILPGARFCSDCGSAAPPPTITVVSSDGSAAAAAAAYEPIYWGRRRAWSAGRLWLWLGVVAALGAGAWIAATNNSAVAQIKSYLTTAHTETIAEISVAMKPHGFFSYKVTVPEGATDVLISGQFETSGQADRDIQFLVVSEPELITWQSGYAISPYYDSGKVSQASVQAGLPRAGTYYLIFSNRASSSAKTVHISTALRYNTWLPESLVYIKDKVWGWFQ